MTTTTDTPRRGGGRALALAFMAAIIEGFDLQSAGVAAPKLIPAFGLQPNQVGLFFSAATFGLIFGSLLGGRTSDAWGRRTALILAMLTFGAFSIGTALVSSFGQLLAMRFLTGVGLGGALPILVTIAAESCAPQYRGRAVAIMYAGVPLGGAVASGVAMSGLHGGDWHMIFLVGGILPLLLAPVLRLMLPPLRVPAREETGMTGALGQIFAPAALPVTAMLWVSFFLGLIVVYALLNWMPQLLVARGLSRPEASTVQVLFNIGGIVGSIVGGRMLDRDNPLLTVAGCFAAAAAALLMLALLPASVAGMLVGGTLVGGAILCIQSILYGIAPRCYPTAIRGTGVGVAVGVGRFGSITGPLLAGAVVASGAGPEGVMYTLVPVTLIAGLATVFLLMRRRGAPALV